MPRQKRDFDSDEVNEIIELKIKEVNGIISKLSYNGVYTLNKKIANNSEFLRKNGELFKFYAYDFWAGQYKGIENYGKQQIDSIKENRHTEYLSGIYEQGLQDVLLAINDLHNNPSKLSYVLINIFKKDRQKILNLEKENILLKEKNKKLKTTLETIQNAVFNIFYNSTSAKNSLINVMEFKKSQDGFINEQIHNAFCTQSELLSCLMEREESTLSTMDSILEFNRKKRHDKIKSL